MGYEVDGVLHEEQEKEPISDSLESEIVDFGESESFDNYDGYDDYMDMIDLSSTSFSSFEEDNDDEEDDDFNASDNKDIIEMQRAALEEEERRKSTSGSLKKEWQEKLFPEKKTYRSVILEYFPVDLCIELEKISRSYYNDNNTKQKKICELLDKYKVPYSNLGSGTNRYGIMIDEYAVKIAYDKDGKIDNKREFIYSLALQPYVVKTYEVSETGLFSVCEYVQSFTESDFSKYSVQNQMRKILKDIASKFMVGDVGISSKNYANWGYRDDGSICILDYAYIYSVSYKQFTCSCDGTSILYYDNDFNNLICPTCGKKYPFSQLRRKISRKDQDEEIGDVTKRGYVIHKPEEVLEFNHEFVLGATDEIMKEILKAQKKEEKKSSKEKEEQDWDFDEPIPSTDEIIQKISEGEYDYE